MKPCSRQLQFQNTLPDAPPSRFQPEAAHPDSARQTAYSEPSGCPRHNFLRHFSCDRTRPLFVALYKCPGRKSVRGSKLSEPNSVALYLSLSGFQIQSPETVTTFKAIYPRPVINKCPLVMARWSCWRCSSINSMRKVSSINPSARTGPSDWISMAIPISARYHFILS